MRESWRWFGPYDKISLNDVAQTGASCIVTALHDVPYGEVWSRTAIAARRDQIRGAGLGLEWNVVESLPLHDRIKSGEGDLSKLFAAYRQSLANLAAEGIFTVCYNFMPVLDWTRTDLTAPVARGGTCLRFSAPRMAAFDVFMLGRAAGQADYSKDVLTEAAVWIQQSSQADRDALLASIMSGLPGAYDRFDVAGLKRALGQYDGIGADDLRANFKRFLQEVIPAAEELGMRLCVHPDDPPRDLLGLPRIASNAQDIAWIMASVDADANGLTLCSGSLGANPANDVPAIASLFAHRIHFAHLRNVKKDPDGSFEETAHLDGDTDMVALISILLDEEKRRRKAGRADHEIPFRPDHGHAILSDAELGTHPGYPLYGRMRGLAELRGVVRALSHPVGGRK